MAIDGCLSHRDICATNALLELSADFGTGGLVRADDIEKLRAAIMAQIDAFNNWQTANGLGSYSKSDPGQITGPSNNGAGMEVDHSHINKLRSTIDQISSTGYTDVNTGDLITAPEWKAILDAYNIVRQDCICNSDCGCNSVCGCNNDCGCNYYNDWTGQYQY